MSKIGLTKLITEIGDENVELQPLDGCLTSMQIKKDHYEYTFGSPEPFGFDGTRKLGLVLWLDRDRVKEILGR